MGYRTRLIGLLGPTFNDAALAEAIAASLYSRLVRRERAGIRQKALFAELTLRDCRSLAEAPFYTEGEVVNAFGACHKHLFNCDRDPKTK